MFNSKSKEDLIDENKNKKRIIIILIIIIIILLLLLGFLGFRVGKIGYDNGCSIPVFGTKLTAINVSDKVQEIDTNTKLDIFSNVKFDDKHMIAPGSSGTYEFMIRNVGNASLSYDILFSDFFLQQIFFGFPPQFPAYENILLFFLLFYDYRPF